MLFYPGLETLDHLLQETSQVIEIFIDMKGNKLYFIYFFFIDKGSQADQIAATIQQMMSSYLKKEEETGEANILRYTEQQQASLLALETRVRQDRNTLLL
jgi:succinyl-CoA synthetase beta subunit